MGGAGLVFDNLGIDLVALTGRATTPSILALNRRHGEEIEVELTAVDAATVWQREPGVVESMSVVCVHRVPGEMQLSRSVSDNLLQPAAGGPLARAGAGFRRD